MPSAKVAGPVICALAILISPVVSFGQIPIPNVQKAVQDVTQAAAVIDSQVQQASSETQAKVDQLPQLPQPPIERKPRIELVSEKDKTLLCQRVAAFADHSQAEERRYSRWALITILLAAGLALIGSITSFLAHNKTAGVISLIVAAVVGFSNAFPLGPVADFYRSLSGQARALSVECEYTRPYSENTYASNLSQLKLPYIYEDKRPGFGNYKLSTDDLTKQLQVVKTVSNNLTLAQTEALSDLDQQPKQRVAEAKKK